MSNKSRNVQDTPHETHGVMLSDDKSSAWGWLAGLIVAVFVALPVSAAISYATHPLTQNLFGGRLSETTQAGYQAFWWIIALLFGSLPFVVGFGVTKLSKRALSVLAAIVALLVVFAIVLGQIF